MSFHNLDQDEVYQQFKLLKSNTCRFGFWTDAQELQLKNWPFILFPHVKEFKFKVNPENRSVEYELITSLKKEPSGKTHARACEYLTEWVRCLFWDDTVIKYRWIADGKISRKTKKPLSKRRGKGKT